MSWFEIKLMLNSFLIGAVVGYFGPPGWNLIRQIIREAKVAKNEWRKSNR
jgi:hypothetical protein